MNDSTRRALRTAFHVLTAVLLVIPSIAAGLPAYAVLGQVVAIAAVVSKVVNRLEESGLIPTWLKGTAPDVTVDPTAVDSSNVKVLVSADEPTADPAP